MAEFKSWQDFIRFKVLTTSVLRYIRDRETESFLNTVLQTAAEHIDTVPTGTRLWRAQRGCEETHHEDGTLADRRPYPDARMKPKPGRATEGRANPKGIPVLYLATSHETAIAEVRPWIGSYVSVGVFKACRELRLVNCRMTTSDRIVWGLATPESMPKEPPPEAREKCVWTHIDYAFSLPVTPDDNVADYASTQIIAELFKGHGYDGIAYQSSLGETGHNVAVFDPDLMEPYERKLYRVKSVKYESEEA